MALAKEPVVISLDELSDDELLYRYYLTKDREIKERICQRFKGLIGSLSRKYYIYGYSNEDIMQVGFLGLTEGIDSWKPDSNKKAKWFLLFCAEREIISEVKKWNRQMRIGEKNKISLDKLKDKETDDYYLDKLMYHHSNAFDGLMTPEERYEVKERQEEIREMLKFVLEGLTPMELICYLQTKRGLTYKEVSQKYGYTTKGTDNALQRCRKKINKKLEELSSIHLDFIRQRMIGEE